MFSKGDTDVGRTNVIEHSIPLMEGTRPIRQSSRWQGLEKDSKVERHVAGLIQRGMVEPAEKGLELAGCASPQERSVLAAMHGLP